MSNINPNNIDGTFPVAGQDNSSQGFRDNFTNIRNNFSYAQNEINDLQSKAITTSALTGATLTNNMSYNVLQNAQLFSPSYTFVNLGTAASSSTIAFDFSHGSAQKVTTSSSHTVSFSGWPPAGQYGALTAWFNIASTSHVLTISATSLIGINDIAGGNVISKTITFDQAGDYLLEFSTVDNGGTVFVKDLTRNASTLRDFNLYWNDSVTATPVLLINYGQSQASFQTVLSLEQGQDSVSSRGSYNSVGIGNITLANISSTFLDTGGVGGYTVTGARGNLVTGTINPVTSGDLLGYFNSVTYTGNVTANVFQQVSSIGMYANGSNVVAGLGGNVAVFTHTPGNTTNTLTQAAGFENDQSAKFYGNVTHSAGFVDQGYQYSSAVTGFWTIITPGKSRMIFDPAGTLATGTVTLPNCTVDGTILSIHSTQTITSFTANTQQAGTTIVPAVTTLASGTGIEYFYHLSENKWYKIR